MKNDEKRRKTMKNDEQRQKYHKYQISLTVDINKKKISTTHFAQEVSKKRNKAVALGPPTFLRAAHPDIIDALSITGRYHPKGKQSYANVKWSFFAQRSFDKSEAVFFCTRAHYNFFQLAMRKMTKNDEKQRKTTKNDEKRQKTMKNNEKQ